VSAKGELLAKGATAEVYAWGDQHILKLYKAGFPPDEAAREARRAHIAHATGLPTPTASEVVQVAGRQGVVYERVVGHSMLHVLLHEPERLQALARQLANLHVAIHGQTALALPALHTRLQRKIAEQDTLPAPLKTVLLTQLEQLPAGDALCHGDFHPENVIMTADGPVIIDWVDATRGNPAADVARTRILLCHSVLPAHLDETTRRQVDELRYAFFDTYLTCYCTLLPLSEQEIAQWNAAVAAARLCERIPAEEQMRLVDMVTLALQ